MHYIYTGHIQTFLPHVIISQTKQYLYLPRIYIILDVLSNPKVIQCIEKDCVSYIQILYCFTEETSASNPRTNPPHISRNNFAVPLFHGFTFQFQLH